MGGGKKMKEKRKRIEGGDIQRVERESEEKNGKCRYFGSCEKKNNNKNVLKNRIVKFK